MYTLGRIEAIFLTEFIWSFTLIICLLFYLYFKSFHGLIIAVYALLQTIGI